MNLRLCVVGFFILFAACSSKETGPGTTANASPSPFGNPLTVKSRIDPCSLLTGDDIKAVQGESFADAKRSDAQYQNFIVAQCYYALPTLANSVVINVTTAKDAAGAPNLHSLWEGTFHKDAEKKDRPKKPSAGERNEEEEEGRKAETVGGLGDEAFWSGGAVGGGLYVLKRDLFFRISVGGAGDEKTKLNKSKALAQNVLKRL